jgi:hypothetical protein
VNILSEFSLGYYISVQVASFNGCTMSSISVDNQSIRLTRPEVKTHKNGPKHAENMLINRLFCIGEQAVLEWCFQTQL